MVGVWGAASCLRRCVVERPPPPVRGLMRQTASAGVGRGLFRSCRWDYKRFREQFTGAAQIRVTPVFAALVEITLA